MKRTNPCNHHVHTATAPKNSFQQFYSFDFGRAKIGFYSYECLKTEKLNVD